MDETTEYMKDARMGQAMDNLNNNPDFHVFRAEILDVIANDAFKIFTDAPADDTAAITGAQQMKKVVDRIDIEMTSLIEQGRLATSYLNNSNTEDGD
jgi:hypothetical protein